MIRLASRMLLGNHCNTVCVLQKREASKIKMVKQLKKLVDRSPKKKWHKNPVMTTSTTTSRGVSDGQRRRAEQVSTVLYNYITSIIDSGELSPTLADMAVDINRVKVTPDFSAVNIYWLSHGLEKDDELEIELKKHEAKLRSILISYRIVGTIPQVTFVQDKTAGRYAEVEKLLRIADFGPDFIPGPLGSSIRTLPQAETTPSDADISEQLQKLSLDFVETKHGRHIIAVDEKTDCVPEDVSKMMEDEKDPVPDLNFRSDLYGLNHEEIMKRLLLKKHKTKHRSSERTLGSESKSEGTVKPVQAPDYEKFLRTKNMLKKKAKITKIDYTVPDYYRYEAFHDFGDNTERGGTRDDDSDDDLTDSDDDTTDR